MKYDRRLLFLILVAFFLSGCSVSHSISSSSDSSSSISRSSSGLEISDQNRKDYIKDLETYTEAIGQSHVSGDDFMRGLSRIARNHGISDWESYRYTYVGVGRGLKAAGIDKGKIGDLPYLEPLLSGHPKRIEYIKEGY